MSDDELLGFSENIPRLEARRMLRAAKMGSVRLTPDGLLTLLRIETGDEETAQRLASKYAFDQQVQAAQEQGGE